jgi:methylenetetrahydrofolate reductase (NADPH)
MGSTKNNSTKVARLISEHGVVPLSHITCYNETKESINKFLSEIKDTNSKLLVLRGDTINQNNLDFYYASDLLSYLKDYKNEKGVAIYVEGHPESSSIDNDISVLLMKNGLGASFSITQMFFNNNFFFSFMDKIKDSPIKIIAGIMPVTRYSSLNRIKDFGNIYVPQELINNLKDANNADLEFEIGINYAYNQIINLVENGYDQIHIYTMNKINVVNRLMSLLDGAIS